LQSSNNKKARARESLRSKCRYLLSKTLVFIACFIKCVAIWAFRKQHILSVCRIHRNKIYKSDIMRPRSKTPKLCTKIVNFDLQEKQEKNYRYCEMFFKNKINLQYLNLGTRGFLTKIFKKKQMMVLYGPRVGTVPAYWWGEKAKTAYFWSWKVTVRSWWIIQSISLLVILSRNEYTFLKQKQNKNQKDDIALVNVYKLVLLD
jgi:hypothetical protein